MFTISVSCVHISPAHDPFCTEIATANCGANDLAMIDLFETKIRSPMIVVWLMDLFGAIGHVGRLDHGESGSSQNQSLC